MPEKKPDKTRNERQARRRAREKLWLAENGFSSWEAVHTALLAQKYHLVKEAKENTVPKKQSAAQCHPSCRSMNY